MKSDTVEQAYQMLAHSILDFIRGRAWDKGICTCQIYSKMASSSFYLVNNGNEDSISLGWPTKGISAGDPALFLRDNLLATTGQRIWGLTFTLYPDGKFNIEYDYNKPDGYEETEETISGKEINESLGAMGAKDL